MSVDWLKAEMGSCLNVDAFSSLEAEFLSGAKRNLDMLCTISSLLHFSVNRARATMSTSCVLSFSLLPCDIAHFAPRRGLLSLHRPGGSAALEISTPGLITATTRGLIPHLSRDHVNSSPHIHWVHVPFESLSVLLPVKWKL